MLVEYATGNYHSIEVGAGIYKVPDYHTFKFPNGVLLRMYGVAGKSGIKFWKENTHLQAPPVIDITNDESIYLQDVPWYTPETFILRKDATYYPAFTGRKKGNTDISKAPVIAIVNTVPNENLKHYGLGRITFSGLTDVDKLDSKMGYGFIYQENSRMKGIMLTDFNSNWSGGGTYWGTENCHFETGDQKQYAITETEMQVKFTNDVSGFNLPEGEWPHVLEFSKPNELWPAREAFASRSAVLQVEGRNGDLFTFILPNTLQIQTYLQQINGFEADPNIKGETDYKKILAGTIPKAGDTITLQREYGTDLLYDNMNGYVLPDMTKSRYECGKWGQAVRSHISRTSVEGKHGNQLEGKFEGGHYLQAGCKIKNKATGITHEVKALSRGYYSDGYPDRPTRQSGYCMEYKPFASSQECTQAGFKQSPDVFVYQNYVLDPPLDIPENPTAENSLVEFEVVESRAAYLLDGGTYKSWMKWCNTGFWRGIGVNGNVNASSPTGHTFYNPREINHDHRNTIFKETDYRENNMNWEHVGGGTFEITDPDTGELIEVRGLAAYPFFGSQHVDSQVPAGQYGGGYNKFMPQRDKLLRSQGVTEEYKCMQRNIGEVNQEQMVVDPYYTEIEKRPKPKRLIDFLLENKK